jgi:hypothetical protein
MTNKKSIHIRRMAFYISIIVLLLLYILMDWFNYYPDNTNPLIVYGFELFWLIVGDILYTGWWIYNGKASNVYIWVTILLYSMTIECTLEAYARYLYIYDRLNYGSYINSLIWYFRGVPKIISLVYMSSLILGRILASKNQNFISSD